MSLNSIKFEPTDIAFIFKNSLVEINAEQQVLSKTKFETEQTVTGLKYLGENKKKTLVVVRNADAVYIPDKQLSFLTKLLSACNLNLADVAIFNFHDHNSSEFNEILNFFKPKVVLLFA